MGLCDQPSATVLIIDDEQLIRQSIATYLEDSGFSVLEAADGPSGMALLATGHPDILLLDLRMPEMDGLEVLAGTTRDYPEMPVIVVTGAGVMHDAVEALRLGACDFISKPIIDMAILENAVCQALERSRLRIENRRYREYLELEIQRRTRDLQKRSDDLELSNRRLETEMAERRRTEARLAEVIAIFEGFIYTVDADYRLSFMNQRLIDHVGADALGRCCHETLYGNPQPCNWCRLPQVLAGETVRTELQGPRDGRWYHGIYSPFTHADDPTPAGCQAIVMDIHDRKMAEETLKASEASLRSETLRLRSTLKGTDRFGNIIGKSRAMHEVYETILRAAESHVNVIIYGASGTGKELVARTIHELSPRGSRPFVAVNCGAIPDNLIESEFFGHHKGAFTGADRDKPGFLTVAHGGTLFLDEVGEIHQNMQVKLLRAIEGGGFTPIGSRAVQYPDIRVIAATNRDLSHQMASGKFRADFFYRIHIIPIELPPLKARKEDIPLLIHHFLQLYEAQGRFLSIPQSVMAVMLGYDWPGNVRELQNAIHRYLTLGRIDFLDAALPPTAKETPPLPSAVAVDGATTLADALATFEADYIRRRLQQQQWHRSKVAKTLGIDRRTLFRKIKSHGIE
jgi:DNA-binding NtrC family response regulator